MLNRLIWTTEDGMLTLLRVTLGVVIFAHGAQKALGWFGGQGFEGTISTFTQYLGIPAVFVLLMIAAEFLGSLGLIVGLLTRVAAFGIACVMAVAVLMVHSKVGFFMNWAGSQKGEGFEYHLLVLAITVVLMLRGAGALSIDRWLSSRKPMAGDVPTTALGRA